MESHWHPGTLWNVDCGAVVTSHFEHDPNTGLILVPCCKQNGQCHGSEHGAGLYWSMFSRDVAWLSLISVLSISSSCRGLVIFDPEFHSWRIKFCEGLKFLFSSGWSSGWTSFGINSDGRVISPGCVCWSAHDRTQMSCWSSLFDKFSMFDLAFCLCVPLQSVVLMNIPPVWDRAGSSMSL